MLLKGMRVPPEYLGITGLMTPGSLHISGNRADMFAAHLPQARVPFIGEHPHMFSGFEGQLADYTFDSTKRDNEIVVLGVINKYDVQMGVVKPGFNPSRTVIYRDLVTGEISYFNLNRYTSFTSEYGYENVMKTHIHEGDVISPDTEIYSSPSKVDGEYRMGANANVAYISMLDTTEDSMVISESLANKLSPLSIETKTISVDLQEYPINTYGDDDVYKILPDIGDQVRSDGILWASRPTKPYAIADLMMSKLSSVNYMTDNKIYAYPNSMVIDIEVYLDSKYDKLPRVYDQIKMYHKLRMKYWQSVINIYQTKCKGLPISNKFNTLVTKAMTRVLASRGSVHEIGKRPKLTLMNKFSSVELLIEVTTAHRVIVNKGFKITGREGSKGVIYKIKPDHEMPVDDHGFRADLCIDPVSILKRTNIFQLYEQYINRVLKYFAMNLDKNFATINEQFDAIIGILADIVPEYSELVKKSLTTIEDMTRYVEECKADTISICIPPGYNGITKELVMMLEEKYRTPVSPVQFIIHTKTGDKTIRTKKPVMIGTKYIYLLHKYPKPLAPGIGYVNQFHFPITLKDKSTVPVGPTPIKFGESESRIFLLAGDIDPVLRMRCLYGNSSIGPKTLIDGIISTKNPITINHIDITTEKLYDNNDAIRIAHHMFNTCGIDMQNVLISDEDANNIINSFSEGEE